MPSREITDMRIVWVDYYAAEGLCRGSNLLYRVNGRPSSSRVPWRATDPAAEVRRIEALPW